MEGSTLNESREDEAKKIAEKYLTQAIRDTFDGYINYQNNVDIADIIEGVFKVLDTRENRPALLSYLDRVDKAVTEFDTETRLRIVETIAKLTVAMITGANDEEGEVDLMSVSKDSLINADENFILEIENLDKPRVHISVARKN